jgi:invasin B
VGDPGARLLQSMLELDALVNASTLDTIRSRLAALTARHAVLRTQCEQAGETFGGALAAAEEAGRQALQAQTAALASQGEPELAAFDAAVGRALAAERTLLAAQDGMRQVAAFQMPALDVSKLQTNASRLTGIIVVLQELLSQANTDAFRARSEFLSEMAQVRREAALKEAVEVERQLRQQEKLNHLFGWLGRAFGWVLAALSLAAAIFTGGASLIVAGVMLGLLVTDQIVSATTGVSPVGETFKAVLSPLIEALASAFEEMMLSLGVDAQTAKLIGQVLASIVAVVVIIVATAVGVGVAARLVGPLVSKLAGGFIAGTTRLLPAAFVRAAQQGGAAFGRLGTALRVRMPGDAANAHVQGVRIAQAANAGYLGVAAMTAGGQIAVAALQMKTSESAANFVQLDHSARVLQQMIDELLGVYSEGLQTLRAMMAMAAEALEDEVHTGRFIMQSIHRSI